MSHNTFGHLFRVTTWGESHGPAIGCVVDGCPPRIPLTEAEIQAELDRRRPGQSRFTTQRREPDTVRILSGVFPDDGRRDGHHRHADRAADRERRPALQGLLGHRASSYRPGHADYTYDAKYGIRDYRGGGRSSARETAMRVAAGAIARKIVPGMTIRGALVRIGEIEIDRARWDWDEVDQQPLLLARRRDRREHGQTISTASARTAPRSARSSRSSPRACRAGLGAPIYGKLDQDIASALMSINAVKGVEIGDGFGAAAHPRRGERRRDAHGQ